MTISSFHMLWRFVLCAPLLLACSSNSDGDAELEGVPEEAAFALSVTDDASTEGSASDDDAIDPTAAEVSSSLDAVTQAVTSNVAPELRNCRDAARALNQALRRFMQPIVLMVRNTEPTTTQGRVKVWGPLTRGETEYRFVLRNGALRRHGWLLEARAAGSDDAFTQVAAGSIAVGFAPRRGKGAIGVDLDALASVDPTVTERGAVLARFAHGAEGSIVGYRLRDFVGERGTEPVNALVQGVHLKGGTNRVRLAYRGNLPESASSAPELLLARARHQRGVGGRADVVVVGGDVAAGRAWIVTECWDAELAADFRRVVSCPLDGVGGEHCDVVSTSGDATACRAPFEQAELPPTDPETQMEDEESPEGAVTPPATMPDGMPSTDG